MSDNILSGFFGRDMAVDLGTANTLVYVRGRGIVLNEPSVVAINVKDNRPLAVGPEAKRMIGRTPSHIQAIRPLRDGVIANFDICEKMLAYFIRRVHGPRNSPSPAWSFACLPVSPAWSNGPCRRLPSPLAPASRRTSSRSPWRRPSAPACPCTSRPATWSWTSAAAPPRWRSSPWAASSPVNRCASAATNSTRPSSSSSRRSTAWRWGSARPRRSRSPSGSACPLEEELHAEIRGRDLITGLPKTIVTTTEEIREAIDEPVSSIVDAVKMTLDKTPPELAADIMEQGIVLTGGGALLHGLESV